MSDIIKNWKTNENATTKFEYHINICRNIYQLYYTPLSFTNV